MGFSRSFVDLNSMPGWKFNSWGYHSNRGYIYHENGYKFYGPTFTTGDIIGCCIGFQKRLAFYTKNGELLDAAVTHLAFDKPGYPGISDIYPTIGLKSAGCHVRVNFGKKPFVFDIVEYIQAS